MPTRSDSSTAPHLNYIVPTLIYILRTGWKHTDNVKLHYKQFLDDFVKKQATNGGERVVSASLLIVFSHLMCGIGSRNTFRLRIMSWTNIA